MGRWDTYLPAGTDFQQGTMVHLPHVRNGPYRLFIGQTRATVCHRFRPRRIVIMDSCDFI